MRLARPINRAEHVVGVESAGTRAMLVALGRRGLVLSERFVRVAMVAATRDGTRKDRRVAARALGHYATIDSVRPFVETLARDPDPAVTHAEPVRAVVNVDALEQRATFAEAEPIELGGESVEARLQRRAGAWTPATITVAG